MILISDHPQLAEKIAQVFPGEHVKIFTMGSNESKTILTQTNSSEVIFLDLQKPQEILTQQLLSTIGPAVAQHVVVLVSRLEADRLLELTIKYPSIMHFLDQTSHFFEKELKWVGALLLHGKKECSIQDFMASNTAVSKTLVREYNRENVFLKDIFQFASSLETFRRDAETIRTAASEMMMNSLFSGPIDPKSQKPKYNHLPRADGVQLMESEAVTFEYASDGDFFCISVTDPFGSLKKERLLETFSRGLSRGSEQVRLEGQGGAGIGSYMLVHSSQVLLYQAEENVFSRVI